MIVTLTLNPSVDRTLEVGALVRGAVVRATGTRVDPGGKGINVSRALAAHGAKTRAVLPAGGPQGGHLVALLEAEGIDLLALPIAAGTRSNTTVVEPDGTTTKLNEPGPALRPDELAAVRDALLDAVSAADWVVLSGSLPPGVADAFYADLVVALRGSGASVAVDTSGAGLRAALPAGPTLVKPNQEELAEATGRTLRTLGDVVDAAALLVEQGAGAVLASLGRDGAVLVDTGGALHGETVGTVPLSSVGAGDAMLAGFLLAGGCGLPALRAALAWGAAAVSLPGSRMPGPGDVDPTVVRLAGRPDRERPLSPA